MWPLRADPRELTLFTCCRCGSLFEALWRYGDRVRCDCGALQETDNDVDGPYTTRVVEEVEA